MEKTRIRLMLDHPFFGILALSLQLVRKDSVRTLGTDGRHVFYNQHFVDSLNPRERMFGYLHEICHVILMHMFRRGDRDLGLWNLACDYAVNPMLKGSEGVTLPEGVLYEAKYENMPAEEIYNELLKEVEKELKKEQQQQVQMFGQGQSGQGDDDQNDDGQNDGDNDKDSQGQGDQDTKDQKQNQENQAQPEPQPKYPKSIQDKIDQAMKNGKVEDAPEDLQQHEVASTVSSAIAVSEISGGMGIVPGSNLDRQLEKLVSKKVSWRSLLRKFVTETCQSDYSWMKPNVKYRQISKGFILPSLHAQNEIKLAVVFDTSGSIDRDKCSKFFAEFLNMLDEIEFKELHVLSCSNKIFNPKVFYKGDMIKYEPSGTGGTASRPVWEYFAKKNITPNCVTYFTDLAIFDFGEKPSYPVLWVADSKDEVSEYYKKYLPFGEVIYME